jgi:hypothetical protein
MDEKKLFFHLTQIEKRGGLGHEAEKRNDGDDRHLLLLLSDFSHSLMLFLLSLLPLVHSALPPAAAAAARLLSLLQGSQKWVIAIANISNWFAKLYIKQNYCTQPYLCKCKLFSSELFLNCASCSL